MPLAFRQMTIMGVAKNPLSTGDHDTLCYSQRALSLREWDRLTLERQWALLAIWSRFIILELAQFTVLVPDIRWEIGVSYEHVGV